MRVKFKSLSNEQKTKIMQTFKTTDEWKTQVTANITKRVRKKKKIDNLCYKDYLIHARCRLDENNKLHLLSTFHFLTVADVEKLLRWVYGKNLPSYLSEDEYKLHRICIFFNDKEIGKHRVYVFSMYGMEMGEKFLPLRKDIQNWIDKKSAECLGNDIVVDEFINDEKEMTKYLEKNHRFDENGNFITKKK